MSAEYVETETTSLDGSVRVDGETLGAEGLMLPVPDPTGAGSASSGANSDVLGHDGDGQQGQGQSGASWEQQLMQLMSALQHLSKPQLIDLLVRLISSTDSLAEVMSKLPPPPTGKRRRSSSSTTTTTTTTSSSSSSGHFAESQEGEADANNDEAKDMSPLVNTANTARFYNWAKYGNKHISSKKEGGETEKLRKEYFKCTSPGCTAKRMILHANDGSKNEKYEGFHNHAPPQRARASKELREQLIERIQRGENPSMLYKTLVEAENIGMSKRAVYNLKYVKRKSGGPSDLPVGEQDDSNQAGDVVVVTDLPTDVSSEGLGSGDVPKDLQPGEIEVTGGDL